MSNLDASPQVLSHLLRHMHFFGKLESGDMARFMRLLVARVVCAPIFYEPWGSEAMGRALYGFKRLGSSSLQNSEMSWKNNPFQNDKTCYKIAVFSSFCRHSIFPTFGYIQ